MLRGAPSPQLSRQAAACSALLRRPPAATAALCLPGAITACLMPICLPGAYLPICLWQKRLVKEAKELERLEKAAAKVSAGGQERVDFVAF